MRAKMKIVIDAGMMILVLLQMAYHLIGDSLHGWLGIMLFVLLILHNILDRKWYLGLFKGKYTPIRFFHTAINILLLASFMGVALSAAFLSSTLSNLFNLKAALLGRRMHMVFTTWSFVLMSVHVGLHWNMVINAVKKWTKNAKHLHQTTARIVALLVDVYGLYAFISKELLKRMFLLSEYAFFNYEESIISLVIDYIAILCMFINLTYCIEQLMSKKKIAQSGNNF